MTEQTEKTKVVDSGIKVGATIGIETLDVATKITIDQLVNLLFCVRGVTFIGAETTTIPDMTKGGRNHDNYMLDNVVKDSTINCMLGFDYENRRDTLAENQWVADAVAAALAAGLDAETVKRSMKTMKEYSTQDVEKFEAKERKWGKHMRNPYSGKPSRIMVHYTKLDKETRLPIPETYKRYMQVEILSAKSPVYRYKDSGEVLSDTDLATVQKYLSKRAPDDLVIRDYSVESVRRITINKTRYVIS